MGLEPLQGGGAENVDVVANGERRSVGTIEDGGEIRLNDIPVQINIDGESYEVDPNNNRIDFEINTTGKEIVEELSIGRCPPGVPHYECGSFASPDSWSSLEYYNGGSLGFSPSDIENADELHIRCTGDNTRIEWDRFGSNPIDITSTSDIEATTHKVNPTNIDWYLQGSSIELKWRNNVEEGVRDITVY